MTSSYWPNNAVGMWRCITCNKIPCICVDGGMGNIRYVQEPIKPGDLMWKMPEPRRYLPTLSELIDRLSITQLKEVFISDHREEYSQEIKDILHDIDLLLKEHIDFNEPIKLDAKTIRNIIVLAQMNLHIWHNESNFRKGIKDGNNLELTHSLNGVRNRAKNKIQEVIGGRKDYKTDCLAAEYADWEPSWNDEDDK